MSLKIVKEYERAVIFRLGRCIAKEPKGPGLFFIVPCIDNIVVSLFAQIRFIFAIILLPLKVIDLRTVTFDVPPQEILTKDSVTVILKHCSN